MISTKLTVDFKYDGWRLDRFVVASIPTLSRMRVQSLIRSKNILLQGAVVKSSEKVRNGEEVVVAEPEITERTSLVPEARNLHILYEDKDFLVMDKEAGVVIHPGAGNLRGTLAGALLVHCSLSAMGGRDRPGIVHRLDKETSGCLVVAKNDVTHQVLSQQFALRQVGKIYLALVQGIPRKPTGRIEAPIRRHPVHRQKMCVGRPSEGRPAVTLYRVVASMQGMSLVECHPQTGRTHQIRVHLKHLGHPILGDAVYGIRGNFSRHLLHAWKLSFQHPTTGLRVEFCASLPADMRIGPAVGFDVDIAETL